MELEWRKTVNTREWHFWLDKNRETAFVTWLSTKPDNTEEIKNETLKRELTGIINFDNIGLLRWEIFVTSEQQGEFIIPEDPLKRGAKFRKALIDRTFRQLHPKTVNVIPLYYSLSLHKIPLLIIYGWFTYDTHIDKQPFVAIVAPYVEKLTPVEKLREKAKVGV